MVPLQSLALEEYHGEYREDNQGDGFLYDLELHQGECAAVSGESEAVCGHLAAVFSQGDAPRQQDYGIKRRVGRYYLHLLQLEMAVPCECHENVRYYQQYDCDNGVFHRGLCLGERLHFYESAVESCRVRGEEFGVCAGFDYTPFV